MQQLFAVTITHCRPLDEITIARRRDAEHSHDGDDDDDDDDDGSLIGDAM